MMKKVLYSFCILWIAPRKAVKIYVKRNPIIISIILLILSAFLAIIKNFNKFIEITDFTLFNNKTIQIPLYAAIISFIYYSLLPLFIKITGKWMGGKGKLIELYNCYSFVQIPFILFNLSLLFSNNLFMKDNSTAIAYVLRIIWLFAGLYMIIYFLILSLISLSEIQKFEKTIAFCNLFAAGFFSFIGVCIILAAVILSFYLIKK